MKEVIIKSKIVGKEGAIGSGKPIAFPDLSAYALRSDFIRLESSFNDFLNGDDTDNVINRWKELEAFLNNISEDYNLLSLLNGKADKATTLSGYGITDAYTKTNVDDLLKAYVTLSGSQTITGEKNFVGGLKVNGSPIYYDKDKKYWKLEGDLLVTGGVTMYGSDSSGGGLADAVAWGNVLGKPSWITDTTPSISISGTSVSLGGSITQSALRTALGLGSNAYTSTAYLPLSGGTIEGGFGSLEIKRNNAYASAVKYSNASGILGYIGINDDYSPMFWNKDMGETSVILHSGNIGSYNAGSATQVMINYSYNQDINYPLVFTSRDNIGIAKNGVLFIDFSGRPTYNPSSNTLSVGNILATGGITTNDSVTINGIKLSKSKDGVLYLDGNLVVKGGVTMYGTDATSSPSIIDSLPIASTSSKGIAQFNPSDFAVKDGVVSFVGSVDGGVASSVSWGNITGKPTFATVATSGKYSDLSGTPSSLPASDVYSWAKSATKPTYEWSEITSKPTWIGSSKPTYTYSEITGAISTTELQNYLTQNSYLNVTSGDNRYLKLLGGTINSTFGGLEIKRNNAYASAVKYSNASGILGYIGINDDYSPMFWNKDMGELGVILHSGNIGSYNAGSATQVMINYSYNQDINYPLVFTSRDNIGIAKNGVLFIDFSGRPTYNPYSNTLSVGNILATGGITMFSMRALKNVVDERGLSLSELSAIKPTRYTWKDGRDNRLHFGGIADDIQQVLPEVVYSTSDGLLTMDYGNAAFAIASSLIHPVIDHEKRIEMLEEENKELRNEIERLKSA